MSKRHVLYGCEFKMLSDHDVIKTILNLPFNFSLSSEDIFSSLIDFFIVKNRSKKL